MTCSSETPSSAAISRAAEGCGACSPRIQWRTVDGLTPTAWAISDVVLPDLAISWRSVKFPDTIS